MVRRRLDDPRSSRNRRELGLEVDEIGADPPPEVRQALTKIDGSVRSADIGEAVEDLSPYRRCVCDRHGLLLGCFETFQRFLKLPEEATGSAN
jgi:hypothetical protein